MGEYFFKMILSYVYRCFACTNVCAPHACSTHRRQKRAKDPLELESQMACVTAWVLGMAFLVVQKSSQLS